MQYLGFVKVTKKCVIFWIEIKWISSWLTLYRCLCILLIRSRGETRVQSKMLGWVTQAPPAELHGTGPWRISGVRLLTCRMRGSDTMITWIHQIPRAGIFWKSWTKFNGSFCILWPFLLFSHSPHLRGSIIKHQDLDWLKRKLNLYLESFSPSCAARLFSCYRSWAPSSVQLLS